MLRHNPARDIGDEKGFRQFSIESDLAPLVLGQLVHHLRVNGGQLSRFWKRHSRVLLTVTKAFVKSLIVA